MNAHSLNSLLKKLFTTSTRKYEFLNRTKKTFQTKCINAKSPWKTKTINLSESTQISEHKIPTCFKPCDPAPAQILLPKSDNLKKKTKTWTKSSCKPSTDSINKRNWTKKPSITSDNKSETSIDSCKKKGTILQTIWGKWPKLSQNFQLWPMKNSAKKPKWFGFKNF